MTRNIIEINVNDFKGDLLVLDSYLEDVPISFEGLNLPSPTITGKFAPEALHLDKLGFKMCTILRLGKVTSVTSIFKEGSPHSIQIPLMIQEAADNIDFPKNKVRYISWDKGLFTEVDDRSIRLCRHPSEIFILSGLFRLARYIKRLRQPDGCPNDQAATLESTIELFREEIEELNQAIVSNDIKAIVDEFGDVTYDLMLFASVLFETKGISISNIANESTEKMIEMHPKVKER